MSEGVPADGMTAGMLLRQAREQAGLHVATLAATLKVPVRKLEALEEDNYDLLGDAVFVRALASSICRTLKVDPQPVLQRLPQTASPRLAQESEGINAPFRAPSDGPAPGILAQVSRPVTLTVMALLIGALVLVFLPLSRDGDGAPPAADAGRATDPVLPPPVAAVPANPAPEAVPSTSPVPVAPTVAPSPTLTAPAAPAAPVAVAPAPGLPAPSGVAASAPTAAMAPQDAASTAVNARGIVVFRTRGPSWIQVTDASGTTVFRRLMEPGESAGASGALPLSVTIGSVEATEVQVRGKPYNLAPVSKDNVARFEVK